MSKSRILLLLVLMSPLFHSTSFAQGFSRDDFKRRTLKEIVSDYKDSECDNGVIGEAGLLSSVIRVKYTGKSRPISDVKRKVLKFTAESLTVSRSREEYATQYQQEMLFSEDGVEYWLPVHKKDSAFILKELKEGEEVDIYIDIVGRIYLTEVCDWLFPVEEFRKPKVSSPK
jgi:hypothetical protein